MNLAASLLAVVGQLWPYLRVQTNESDCDGGSLAHWPTPSLPELPPFPSLPLYFSFTPCHSLLPHLCQCPGPSLITLPTLIRRCYHSYGVLPLNLLTNTPTPQRTRAHTHTHLAHIHRPVKKRILPRNPLFHFFDPFSIC